MPLFRRLGSAMVILALPFLQLVFEPSSLQKLMTAMNFSDGDSRIGKNDNNITLPSSPLPHPLLAWHGREDLLHHNRFFSAAIDDNLLQPLAVMKTYIQQHNNDILEQEWRDCQSNTASSACHALQQRKFLTATYACPMEAGNRMHRFMNGLLWAVLTNRTLLYRYHTVEVCREYDNSDSRCQELFHSPGLFGNATDCDGILHLHDWVPSYDEWVTKLQLSNITRAQLHPKQPPDHATLPFDAPNSAKIIRTGLSYQLSPGDILYGGGGKYLQQPDNVARLQQLTNISTHTPNDKVYFLYGMLQEALFTMDVGSLMSGDGGVVGMNVSMEVGVHNNDYGDSPPPSTHTFVLHSRHTGTHPDNYIWPEHMCLERIKNATIANDNVTSTRPSNCHIYVMSDRDTTLQLLHDEIDRTTNCSHSSVNLTSKITTTPSFHAEHGPFAGRGFWQDWVMSSQARQGMIAFHMHGRKHGLVRTSSALVRERIEFRRTLEWYATNKRSMPPQPFWQCQNPWKE